MLALFIGLPSAAAVSAFFQVVMIDLTLAGDNAVAVGLAAAGLPRRDRRRAIVLGMAAAVVMLIGFALIAVQLLQIIGLLFAGGVLLLYVCWKMWSELREQHAAAAEETSLDETGGEPDGQTAEPPQKTLRQAMIQILLADVSMSLDNVLAVAGAAREQPIVLVFGLMLSIGVTAVAASFIARLLHRFRWLGYVGLTLVFWVSLSMMWHGHRDVVERLHWTPQYNAFAPDFIDIRPEAHARPAAH